jgi:hypothetical protein
MFCLPCDTNHTDALRNVIGSSQPSTSMDCCFSIPLKDWDCSRSRVPEITANTVQNNSSYWAAVGGLAYALAFFSPRHLLRASSFCCNRRNHRPCGTTRTYTALVVCAFSTRRHALGLRFLADVEKLDVNREGLRRNQRRSDHLGDYGCRLGRLRSRLLDADIRRCARPDRCIACRLDWIGISRLAKTWLAQPRPWTSRSR